MPIDLSSIPSHGIHALHLLLGRDILALTAKCRADGLRSPSMTVLAEASDMHDLVLDELLRRKGERRERWN